MFQVRLFFDFALALALLSINSMCVLGAEYLNVPPETETREVRRPVTRSSPNVIFKGINNILKRF